MLWVAWSEDLSRELGMPWWCCTDESMFWWILSSHCITTDQHVRALALRCIRRFWGGFGKAATLQCLEHLKRARVDNRVIAYRSGVRDPSTIRRWKSNADGAGKHLESLRDLAFQCESDAGQFREDRDVNVLQAVRTALAAVRGALTRSPRVGPPTAIETESLLQSPADNAVANRDWLEALIILDVIMAASEAPKVDKTSRTTLLV